MYPAKNERNKQIIKLRNKDKRTYTFKRLAEMFNIKKQTAHAIYNRGCQDLSPTGLD